MRRRSHISRRQARDAAGRFSRKVERGPRVVDNPAVVDPVDSEDDVKPEVERGPRVVHTPAVVIAVDSDSDVEPEVERGPRVVHTLAVVIAVDSDSEVEPVVPTVRAAPSSTRTTKVCAVSISKLSANRLLLHLFGYEQNTHGASSSHYRLNVTKINSKVRRPKYVVTFDKVEIKCTFTDESDDEDPGKVLHTKEIMDKAEEMRLAIKSKMMNGHGMKLK
ncbi:hypothetical protein EJB05_13473, partial [Eragrostis curvula]